MIHALPKRHVSSITSIIGIVMITPKVKLALGAERKSRQPRFSQRNGALNRSVRAGAKKGSSGLECSVFTLFYLAWQNKYLSLSAMLA